MNEIQIIREQLATERMHASAVANACAEALGHAPAAGSTGTPQLTAFRQACLEYLVSVLAWFDERDQRLADLLRSRPADEDPSRRALQEALLRPGRSREALERLEAACATTTAAAGATAGDGALRSWQEFARYFNGVWDARREALDGFLAVNPRVEDWRAIAGVDADSILEERRRYARVGATLPAGIAMAAAPQPGEAGR